MKKAICLTALALLPLLAGCSGGDAGYSATQSCSERNLSPGSAAYQQCVKIERGIAIQNQVNQYCATQGFKQGSMDFDRCAIAKKTSLVSERSG